MYNMIMESELYVGLVNIIFVKIVNIGGVMDYNPTIMCNNSSYKQRMNHRSGRVFHSQQNKKPCILP
jgi:hypothetical protein